MKKFLEWFEKNAFRFQLDNLKFIRSINDDCCPLQIYTNKKWGYLDLAVELGLSENEIRMIMSAADCPANLSMNTRVLRVKLERMMSANSQSS